MATNVSYIVEDYTNDELYKLLDVSHPSDRELEAKILNMMSRYEKSNTQMYNFFVDVYQHFFEEENQETQETVGFLN
jgi:hypothetical protein